MARANPARFRASVVKLDAVWRLRWKKIERKTRRAFFGALLGRSTVCASELTACELARVQRVLLVRVNFRLGNLLLTTPAFAAVRQALPAARIGLLASAPYVDLVARNPDLDFVLAVTRRTFWQPAQLIRLVRSLRRERFDLVIDLARGSSVLGAICTGVSGGRWRVGQAESRYRSVFNVRVPRRRASGHKVDLLLDYLAQIGIPPSSRHLQITLDDMECRRARALVESRAPADMTLVGVHFGGRGSKRWPLAYFLALVDQLARDPHLRVVLFSGPEEGRFTREMRSTIPTNVIQMPLMPLRDFAAALQRCRLFIGTDSGPLHLAAAVGTATIGIYTTETFRHYRQLGNRHQVLFHLGGTNVDAVVVAVRAALSENDTSSTGRNRQLDR